MNNKLLFPPGDYLQDIINDVGVSYHEYANLLGVEIELLLGIINAEIAVDKDMAIRLELVTGVDADTWINLQKVYDRRKV